MALSKFTEFNIQPNAYAAFDATSMKQLITNRIRASGLFPDIDFEGSNVSGLVDIVAYMYHVLMFYLNQTATESMFTQAELYENMNKLVSLIGYKPRGYSTPVLSIECTATADLAVGMYAVPKFTYLYVNNIAYTFVDDVVIEKTLSGEQAIPAVGENRSMYHGVVKEYPTYVAIGEDFEQFTITTVAPIADAVRKYIDENTIYVYVKDVNSNTWSEWSEIVSLYLASAQSRVFEKRLNEDGRYEIKFGNSVHGRRLNTGDIVAVYYLESNGNLGTVSVSAIANKPLVKYNTTQWNEIFTDIRNPDVAYMLADELQYIKLNNTVASTPFTVLETVQQIKDNAPLILATQNRTVTVGDYEAVVNKYYNNLITSVRAVSNKLYTSEYLKYFYDIGLEKPNDDERVLMNQVTFADACDFNNVYLFVVPKLGAIQNGTTPIALATSQKQAIVNTLNQIKLVNQNVVVCDPIYKAFSFGLNVSGEEPATTIKDETYLKIYRTTNVLVSKELIKAKAAEIIRVFFAQENRVLGDSINVAQLNIDLLAIPGVGRIETVREGTENRVVPKINMIIWNPFYPDATPEITSQNLQLKFFEFPFFYEVENLTNKIQVV